MNRDRLSRRDAIGCGVFGAGSLLWPRTLPAAPPQSRAKSVIQIWMWGGPSHTDTFDPKPGAGYDYYGAFDKPIATKTDGAQINELLPLLAQQSDKYSIIRGMTHGVFAHETASYMTQTGRKPGERLVYPCAGAVVKLFKEDRSQPSGLIPPYIVLTQPQGRFSESGFLGQHYMPFATGGDPAQARFAVEGIVAQNVTEKRQRDRRELLHHLNTLGRALQDNGTVAALDRTEKQAYELILGDAGQVFDLSLETDAVRDSYGRNTFGQSCLVARRLVERGTPYVTINYPGWDTHRQNFQTMRQKLPQMDRGMATLFQDLAERGLLESTIVWWGGEFGRTPKVMWEAPWNGGRNHWGDCFSAVVGGGGFRGGCVVGSTDDKGEQVRDRPVFPADLIGSIYELLGIDPDGRMPNALGIDAHVTPVAGDGIRMAGRLKEIM